MPPRRRAKPSNLWPTNQNFSSSHPSGYPSLYNTYYDHYPLIPSPTGRDEPISSITQERENHTMGPPSTYRPRTPSTSSSLFANTLGLRIPAETRLTSVHSGIQQGNYYSAPSHDEAGLPEITLRRPGHSLRRNDSTLSLTQPSPSLSSPYMGHPPPHHQPSGRVTTVLRRSDRKRKFDEHSSQQPPAQHCDADSDQAVSVADSGIRQTSSNPTAILRQYHYGPTVSVPNSTREPRPHELSDGARETIPTASSEASVESVPGSPRNRDTSSSGSSTVVQIETNVRPRRAPRTANNTDGRRPRNANTPWTTEDTNILVQARYPENGSAMNHNQIGALLGRTPQATRLHLMQTLRHPEYEEIITEKARQAGMTFEEFKSKGGRVNGTKSRKRSNQAQVPGITPRCKRSQHEPPSFTRRDSLAIPPPDTHRTSVNEATEPSVTPARASWLPDTHLSPASEVMGTPFMPARARWSQEASYLHLRPIGQEQGTNLLEPYMRSQRRHAFADPSQNRLAPIRSVETNAAHDAAAQGLLFLRKSETESPISSVQPQQQTLRYLELRGPQQNLPTPQSSPSAATQTIRRYDSGPSNDKNPKHDDDNTRRSSQSYDDRIKSLFGRGL